MCGVWADAGNPAPGYVIPESVSPGVIRWSASKGDLGRHCEESVAPEPYSEPSSEELTCDDWLAAGNLTGKNPVPDPAETELYAAAGDLGPLCDAYSIVSDQTEQLGSTVEDDGLIVSVEKRSNGGDVAPQADDACYPKIAGDGSHEQHGDLSVCGTEWGQIGEQPPPPESLTTVFNDQTGNLRDIVKQCMENQMLYFYHNNETGILACSAAQHAVYCGTLEGLVEKESATKDVLEDVDPSLMCAGFRFYTLTSEKKVICRNKCKSKCAGSNFVNTDQNSLKLFNLLPDDAEWVCAANITVSGFFVDSHMRVSCRDCSGSADDE